MSSLCHFRTTINVQFHIGMAQCLMSIALTIAIILVGTFGMYEYNSYHESYAYVSIDADSPEVLTRQQVAAMIQNQTERFQQTIGTITNTLKALKDDVHQNLSHIRALLNENTEKIESNTENFNQIKEHIQEMKDNIDSKPDAMDIHDQRLLFEKQTRINYVHRVACRPKLIPFGTESEYKFDESQSQQDEGLLGSVVHTWQTGWDAFQKMNSRKMDEIVGHPRVNIAKPAISSTLQPPDCLQFDARDNWIEVQLSQKIKPTQFEYIHIEKEKIDRDSRMYSPKRFTLFGKIRGEVDWVHIEIEEGQNEIMDIDQSSIRLDLIPEREVEFVRIQYETNEDAMLTRLYRVRIESEVRIVQAYEQKHH